jgi:N-glycosylase/DNA lyase
MNKTNRSLILRIKKEYKSKKREIQSRLKEFSGIGKRKNPDELFLELCYCLCTPLSKAERVNMVINSRYKDKLKKADSKELSLFLKGNCRFHNNKAKYICQSRGNISILFKLPTEPTEAREILVKNIKGLGYKEASHFLRNIGYREIAILDGHIINTLHQLGVLKSNKRPHSRKEYLAFEEKMKDFANKINIDIDELDLLFWFMKTGIVLK